MFAAYSNQALIFIGIRTREQTTPELIKVELCIKCMYTMAYYKMGFSACLPQYQTDNL